MLVTGNAGFIGANLTRKLIDCDYEVKGIDNLCTGVHENIPVDVDMIYGNITNVDTCFNAVRNADIVVHLAADSGVQKSVENPIVNADINVMGTLNLLKCSVDAKVEKFIFASSGGTILGAQEPPVHEESPIKPISPYGASKAACEHYCNAFNDTYGLDTTIVRFSNVYGPYSLHKKNNLIPAFILSCMGKQNFQLFGDGQQTRDFIYVNDLVNALSIIIEESGDSQMNGETFQIATGVEIPIIEVIDMMQVLSIDITGSQNNISSGPVQVGDVRKNYALINKAKEVLKWEPEYSVKEGLEELFNYYFKGV